LEFGNVDGVAGLNDCSYNSFIHGYREVGAAQAQVGTTSMMFLRQGTLRLFRFAGIEVFVHWSWFLVAAYEIGERSGKYSSVTWNVVEYLALFLIVMLHEFGHALACRQVGGMADQIVLWPLGGVAYVNPPPRPGATLWSIAAGPLVNAVLIPIFYALTRVSFSMGLAANMPDVYRLIESILFINIGLLLFNMLPIYPLDGGQILRALLWFPLGCARSLMVATVLGFVGVAGFLVLAAREQSTWFGVLAIFILFNSVNGWKRAKALHKLSKLPRRLGYSCPACKAGPPIGNFWMCSLCNTFFDMFEHQGVCPNCMSRYSSAGCLDCGTQNPLSAWAAATEILVTPR
jgi:Zn-dependent protease